MGIKSSSVVRLLTRATLRKWVREQPEPTNEPRSLWLTFGVSLLILSHFLGFAWTRKYIFPDGVPGFLKYKLNDNSDDLEDHLYLLMNLAEMLFNLQHYTNFKCCLAQLAAGNLEDTYAELETARFLHQFGIKFEFVEPRKKTGFDYDLNVILKCGYVVASDTKCKIAATSPSRATILNSLRDAHKRNLPKDRASFIFLRVPDAWLSEEQIDMTVSAFDDAVTSFFRNTTKVASIKLHTTLTSKKEASHSSLLLLSREADNRNCEFKSRSGWSIFHESSFQPYRWLYLIAFVGRIRGYPVRKA